MPDQQIIIVNKPKGGGGKGKGGGRGGGGGGGKSKGSPSGKDKDQEIRGRGLGQTASELCQSQAPPPNLYKLKNLVGYVDHDLSKWIEPAYTMKGRQTDKLEASPGPMYHVGDTTRHGPKSQIAYSMGRRHSSVGGANMPGPSEYAPEKHVDLRFKRAPSATINGRTVPVDSKKDLPGPNYLPGPNKTPAAVLVGRKADLDKNTGPGPDAYGSPNIDSTKKAAPYATIGQRHPMGHGSDGPGPGAYNPKLLGKSPPSFSFGSKHSKCVTRIGDKDADSLNSICN